VDEHHPEAVLRVAPLAQSAQFLAAAVEADQAAGLGEQPAGLPA
jgi:hypothetical protein